MSGHLEWRRFCELMYFDSIHHAAEVFLYASQILKPAGKYKDWDVDTELCHTKQTEEVRIASQYT